MRKYKILTACTYCYCWILCAYQDKPCTDANRCLPCHCTTPCFNGSCTGNKRCQKGWFGHGCQYYDLLTTSEVSMKLSPSKPSQKVSGGDCQYNVSDIIVSWTTNYPLSWIRLLMKEIDDDLNIRILYKTNNSVSYFIPCRGQSIHHVTNKVLDVWCHDGVNVMAIKIEGTMKSVCFLRISGGRNFAYGQKAVLSSTYTEYGIVYNGDLAVDGNTESRFEYDSCAHSGTEENRPKLSITLSQPVVITRVVLYNRDEHQSRLKKFILEMLNTSDHSWFRYVDPLPNDQSTYTILIPETERTKTISITATNIEYRYDENPILTLCEVEAYGECPIGYWGLTCSEACPKECNKICHIDNGQCNAICFGYSDPPSCKKACMSGRWGINCRQNCSERCYKVSCNRTSGLCDQGCLGYSDPPKCSSVCLPGQWGINCSKACSEGCLNSSCNALTGHCDKGCLGYSNPPYCNAACTKGTWGSNCSETCPQGCLHLYCNNTSGLCKQGCLGYSNPPVCSVVCQGGFFGINCTQNCSITCVNGTCDQATGFCHGCYKSYYGNFCEHLKSSLLYKTQSIIGAIFALFIIALCLAVIGFTKRKQLRMTVRNLKCMSRIRENKSDFCGTEQNYLDEKDKSEANSEESSRSSYSVASSFMISTTITVKDLQTFLLSQTREYFVRQFKMIPKAQNVSWDIGLSEENRAKNRYKDIVTYDHSRVTLERNDAENEGDYINASYIKGFLEGNGFIASQGPNKTMINDFVRMLWEQKTKKVVMLTNLVENGKTKCERYWPEKGKAMFGQIKVNVISTQTFADYTIRIMQLSKGDDAAHILTQYHFTSWPDKNVPITPWSLVEFYHKVYMSPSSVPTVVHCSAGVGRTGTFIALCNIMDQAKETGKVDFFNTLSKLRQDRICMIQTVEQYVFLHKLARVALLCMGTFITQSNITERLVDLNKRINTSSKMEEEFSSLCEMCHCEDESESGNENMTEADQLYQNVKTTEQKKDRFPELAPKDCYRVHLSDINNDYIHAVYIQSYTSRDANILTQLPLPDTIVDFWKCVVENKISLIVTFELDTSGSDKSVVQYLPEGVEQYFMCPPVKVQSLSLKTLKMGEERKLNVTLKSVHHKVIHIKADLNDLDPRKLLTLINQIRSYDVQGRTMFVCKNGSTFSGLACTLVSLLDRLDKDKLVSVPLVVGSVKAIRPKAIDTMTEYRTVYEVLQRYIETSSSYANVEVSNLPKFSMSRHNPAFTEDENQDENLYCNY